MFAHIVCPSFVSWTVPHATHSLLGFVSALERQRTINSMPLAEEREILKQIARVQKKKREVEVFENYDAQLKEKKVRCLR